MSVAYENENVEQSADTISDEKNNTIETIKQSHDSRSQNDIAVRNQTTEEQNYSEQRGNSKISQQSIKYKDHSHYHTNKPGTYVSAINGIEKETHKSKHIICILIIQIIVLKIQLQIITKKVSRLQRYHQLFWHNET